MIARALQSLRTCLHFRSNALRWGTTFNPPGRSQKPDPDSRLREVTSPIQPEIPSKLPPDLAEAFESIDLASMNTSRELTSTVLRNLDALTRHVTDLPARSLSAGANDGFDLGLLPPPVMWDLDDRYELADRVTRMAYWLAKEGMAPLELRNVVVTGSMGTGKTTALKALTQGLALTLASRTTNPDSYELLVGSYPQPPLLNVSRERGGMAPPRGAELSPNHALRIPAPVPLLVLEVVRAYYPELVAELGDIWGTQDAGSAQSGTSQWPSTQHARQEYLSWHTRAFEYQAFHEVSHWLRTHKKSVVLVVDEFPQVFGPNADTGFAHMWLSQLVEFSREPANPAFGVVLSGSSSLSYPLLARSGVIDYFDIDSYPAIPMRRSPAHRDRISFITLRSMSSEASFAWMLRHAIWPRKSPHVEQLLERNDQAASASVPDGLPSLNGVFLATHGLPRQIERFANDGISQLHHPAAYTSQLSSKLGWVYRALAYCMKEKHRINLLNILQSPFDSMHHVQQFSCSLSSLRKHLTLIREVYEDSGVPLPSSFSDEVDVPLLEEWSELGYLDFDYRSRAGPDPKIGFTSSAYAADAISMLYGDSFGLHDGVVRAALRPEGASAVKYGEPIIAASLCEADDATPNRSRISQLFSHLVVGPRLKMDPMLWETKIKPALANVLLSCSEHDSLNVLRDPSQLAIADLNVQDTQSPRLSFNKLYKPQKDEFGTDWICVIPIDDKVAVAVAGQSKLSETSPGCPHVRIEPGGVRAAAARFAVGFGMKNGVRPIDALVRRRWQLTEDTTIVPVTLLVTNRRASSLTITTAESSSSYAHAHTNVDGLSADKHESGLLVPSDGAGCILPYSRMLGNWASPITLLAHELKLLPFGGTINDVAADRLRLKLGTSAEPTRRLLVGGLQTRAEVRAEEEKQQRMQAQTRAEVRAEEEKQQRMQAEEVRKAESEVRRRKLKQQLEALAHEAETQQKLEELKRKLHQALSQHAVSSYMTALTAEGITTEFLLDASHNELEKVSRALRMAEPIAERFYLAIRSLQQSRTAK